MNDTHDSSALELQRLSLSGAPLTIADVHGIARRRQSLELTRDVAVRKRMRRAEQFVRSAVDEHKRVYGVTTGFGSMAGVVVPRELAADSQNNLLWFLAAGAGRPIDPRHVRAAMLLRANMLLRGASGVRIEIVERLIRFLAADAVPIVGELGSIGASGDLIPLATIARAISGQGAACRIQWQNDEHDGHCVLEALGLEPLELLPKEALAIVNGTSFSSGIAANCVRETHNLLGLSLAVHTMMLRALRCHEEPFEAFVHECKPHPGQLWTARMLRLLNEGAVDPPNGSARDHLQDRYSLRCLPQYFGPLVEGLTRVAGIVETEMNSVTDNPLIDADGERFYQSGNFLGQYIGIAMDDLRRHIGLLAKHLDVQIAQLVSPEFNHGLPASLQGNEQLSYNMGLKGLQITGNSIMPLLTWSAHPLVEHFPTHAEQYNQNINGLSWGAAHLTWRSVELFQQYVALALIFAVQALDLRVRVQLGHYDGRALLGPRLQPLYTAVCEVADTRPAERAPLIFNDADQSLETMLAALHADIRGHGKLVHSLRPLLQLLDEFDLDPSVS